jgi:hypothetical protein
MVSKARIARTAAVVAAAVVASTITGVVASASSVASTAPPPWIEVATHGGPLTVHDDNTIGTLASVSLPKGNYLLSAKSEFENNEGEASFERIGCFLMVGSNTIDNSDADVPYVSGELSEETIALSGAIKLTKTTKVSLGCATADSRHTAFAYNTVVTAIRAGSLVTKALSIP